MKLYTIIFGFCILAAGRSDAMNRIQEVSTSGSEAEDIKAIIDLLLQDLVKPDDGPEAQARKELIKDMIGRLLKVIELAHAKCVDLEEQVSSAKQQEMLGALDRLEALKQRQERLREEMLRERVDHEGQQTTGAVVLPKSSTKTVFGSGIGLDRMKRDEEDRRIIRSHPMGALIYFTNKTTEGVISWLFGTSSSKQ